MANTFYALFTSQDEVEAAEREAKALVEPKEAKQPFEFVHHEGRHDNEAAPLQETRAFAGIVRYALVGGLIGIVLGCIGGLTHELPISVFSSMFFGALVGMGLGAFSGVFVGPTLPDPGVQRIDKHLREGRVMVTVSAPTPERQHQAEEIFRRHGAAIQQHETV